METAVVLATAGLAVLWSIRSYALLGDRFDGSDESPLRMVAIIAPSAYFLLLILVGWQRDLAVRLDLVGMLLVDGLTLLAIMSSFVIKLLPERRRHPAVVVLLIIHHLLSIAVVSGAFVVRESPALLFSLQSLLRRLAGIELLSFAWVGLDADRQEQDIVAFLNRVLLAVFSYIPIALVRLLAGIRQRKRLERRIDRLERRIASLESQTDRGDF
jgi:hypothetical protein